MTQGKYLPNFILKCLKRHSMTLKSTYFFKKFSEEVKKILKDDFDNLELICDGDKKRWLKETIKESKSADSVQK